MEAERPELSLSEKGQSLDASAVLDAEIEKVAELKRPTKPAEVTLRAGRGLELKTMDDLWRFAVAVSKSGLAPKGLERAESIFVALELGMEVGLPPMSALQNIAVINGRPGIFGDAALALVRASGLCEDFDEWYEVDGDRWPGDLTGEIPLDAAAFAWTKRKGARRDLQRGFSVKDAQRAKLWGKEGPWTFYPGRMLRFRARGFCLRDAYPDVLKGFKTVEELIDYEPGPGVEPLPATGADKLRAQLGLGNQ